MAHEHQTTVASNRSGGKGLAIAGIAILLVLVLVWAIFFSGWFVERSGSEQPTQTNFNETEEGDTGGNIQQPQEVETQAPPNPGSPGGGGYNY